MEARTSASCFSNCANCARTARVISASVAGHWVPVSLRSRAQSAPTKSPRLGKCRYTVRAAIPDRSAIASCETVCAGFSRSIAIALSRIAFRVDSRCRSCADRAFGRIMTEYCHHVSVLSRASGAWTCVRLARRTVAIRRKASGRKLRTSTPFDRLSGTWNVISSTNSNLNLVTPEVAEDSHLVLATRQDTSREERESSKPDWAPERLNVLGCEGKPFVLQPLLCKSPVPIRFDARRIVRLNDMNRGNVKEVTVWLTAYEFSGNSRANARVLSAARG